MSSFRVRPRFSQTVEMSVAETRARILLSLAGQPSGLVVRDFPEFIGLHISDDERRYWSPRLFLHLEGTPHGTTRIEGIYGTEIEVWSLFLYGYLITGLLGMFSGIFGAAQMVIADTPSGFWVTGAMALLAAMLYVGAQLGRKFGAWQTFKLHQAYQSAIGVPVETA